MIITKKNFKARAAISIKISRFNRTCAAGGVRIDG